MGAGEGKKARNFGPPAFGLPPFEHPRCGAPPFGPPTLRAPTLWVTPLFLGLGPYVPHFYLVAHLFFFCAFLIVSILDA